MATDSKDAVDLDAKFNELMSLSPADRLALGERLIESVPMFVTPEEERAFNEEIARRIDDLNPGEFSRFLRKSSMQTFGGAWTKSAAPGVDDEPLVYHPSVHEELAEAIAFYEQTWTNAVQRIQENPTTGILVERRARILPVTKFRLGIVFKERSNWISIVALHHFSRRDDYWIDRIAEDEE